MVGKLFSVEELEVSVYFQAAPFSLPTCIVTKQMITKNKVHLLMSMQKF